jgi:VIT1/CCC1 family predicted Fe2+/Mn2+ transporter
MLPYAIFVTFVLGILIGAVGTVAIAIRMEERKYQAAIKIHPSSLRERLRSIVND